MNIRFTSSLTPDDENMIAPVVLQTLSAILSLLPVAYVIRVDTSDSKVFQISSSGTGGPHILPRPVERRSPDDWRFQPDVT